MAEQARTLARDSLSESVSREMRRLILSGEVGPGEWLPPQPELASRFGVGLSTVREGIKGLTLLGILRPQPGRGTQVSPDALHLLRLYDVSRARLEGLDLTHLLEARKTVELALTVLAAGRATEDDIARIRAALERMRHAMDDDAFAEADLEFHLAVAQAGKNPLLESFYHVARGMLAEAIRESLTIDPARRGARRTIIAQQERILSAIATRNVRAARRYAEAMFVYWDEFMRISGRG
jgi:DNA-binding FadR family transcriptional regulator